MEIKGRKKIKSSLQERTQEIWGMWKREKVTKKETRSQEKETGETRKKQEIRTDRGILKKSEEMW